MTLVVNVGVQVWVHCCLSFDHSIYNQDWRQGVRQTYNVWKQWKYRKTGWQLGLQGKNEELLGPMLLFSLALITELRIYYFLLQVFGLYFMQTYIGIFYHALLHRNFSTLRTVLIQRLLLSEVVLENFSVIVASSFSPFSSTFLVFSLSLV